MIVSLLRLSFKKSLPSINIKDQLSLYHSSLCLTKLYLLIFLCLLRCTTKLLQFPPAWVIWRSLGKSQQLIISSLVKWMRLDEQASFSKMKCSHGYSSVKLTSQPISQRCLSVTACWSRLGLQHWEIPCCGFMLAGIQEPQLNACVAAINDANLFIYLEIFRPCVIEG